MSVYTLTKLAAIRILSSTSASRVWSTITDIPRTRSTSHLYGELPVRELVKT